MSTTCKNCNNLVDGNFCSYCGQSTSVGRVNLHTIIHEFLHGIVHVDKGIIYTAKELTLRPGQTIRDYFEGKRVRLFKPFGYMFLLATAYIFLSILAGQALVDVDINYTGENSDEVTNNINYWNKLVLDFMHNHFALISFSLIPFISIVTLLFFRVRKYNYGEHLVMNSYIYGHQMLLGILFIPFGHFLGQNTVVGWNFFGSIILFVYMISSTFNSYKLWKRITYAIMVQIIFFVLMVLIGSALVILFITYNNLG